MPWKESSAVDLRMRLALDGASGLYTMSDLAGQYGISRKTAYKWVGRFLEEGIEGLEDRPCVADVVANRTSAEVEGWLVALRREHRTWGPKKLLNVLERQHPAMGLPARSTVAEILKRHGLVKARVTRRREGHPGRPAQEASRPNQVWGMDFKGQFRTRNGQLCYPFTVTDLSSRYLVCCDGYRSTAAEGVKASLQRAFLENGLPETIRSDNGSPFASTGIGRLTRLGVWLLKLGIKRELIQPGRPSQNGRHERMHKTLKDEATRPPKANIEAQQRAFDEFVREFNHDRPHEALGMSRPAEVYQPSPRPYPSVIPEPTYPGHFEVRRVSRNGGVKWRKKWLNVGHSLIEENLGFEQIANGLWDAYFMTTRIGRFDETAMTLVGTMATHYRCGKRGDRVARQGPEQGQGDLRPSHSAATAAK
jgi:transposase InsO family protein